MTPTREQVIEWAKEAGFVYNNRIGEFSTPLTDGAHLDELERLCSFAYSAGREQGLREAREVCEANPERQQEDGSYIADQHACTAAIKQLEGK